MPRKFRTPASVAQNRDNQRRCRARQRKLMDEMREQLKEYERRGVQASLEMQHAAREVLWENRRLRILLARRGVPLEEIRAFLQLPDEAVDDPALGDAARHSVAGSLSASVRLLLSSERPPQQPSSSIASSPCRQTILDHTATVESCRNDGPCRRPCDPVRVPDFCNENIQSNSDQDGFLDMPPRAPRSHYPPDLPAPTDSRRPIIGPLETSCTVAASIITGLRGYGDAAEALVALGCSEMSNCLVKNTTLFQLMDDAT